MHDILFCITPHYDSEMPSIALAILNAVAKQNGYQSKLVDFNLDLFHQSKYIFDNQFEEWTNVDTIFSHTNTITSKKLSNLIDQWANYIKGYNPKYVAFSVLSSFNYLCVVELAKRLKDTPIKIVVGGVSAQWFKSYLEEHHQLDLVDHIVIGFGETAIVKILREEETRKVIISNTIDFTTNIIPDYSDLDLTKYTGRGLFLSTSRGCIYSCSFCHVKYIWKEFIQRPINYVIEEMEYQRNKYGLNYFKSTDSIINAVMPRFRKLCSELNEKDFTWDAMFSIRNKVMVENDYKLLHDAGCEMLFIGVESGSKKVRQDMGKRFSDFDLFQTLDRLEKYKVNSCLMFITGYPTEEPKDFDLTKKLIYEIKQKGYQHVSSIRGQFISTVHLPELEKLHNQNFSERYNRYYELREYIRSLGFRVKQDKRLKKWGETHCTSQ